MSDKNKYFNRITLLKIFDGDELLVDDAINSFAETLPDLLNPWEKSFKIKDTLVLARSSHALKGAVLAFGCDLLGVKLSKLDHLCRENKPWDEIKEAFHDCWAQIKILILEIKNWNFKRVS